jgi:hypothetical protein
MVNGVQAAFNMFYEEYQKRYLPSPEQNSAAFSIMLCKTGHLGVNVSTCEQCGHIELHNNSCRNRNCPSCQAVSREIWIDNRSSEIIDASYYHVVFTLPHGLNDLIYANQSSIYQLFHKAVSATLLQLSEDKKFLGATPGIIQVLHTWGEQLNYHPHIHCIVTGAGLTKGFRFLKSRDGFFIPVQVLSAVFRGKFVHMLQNLFASGRLLFPGTLKHLANPEDWELFVKTLYRKDWFPFIKETFKNFGNAVEYLGRYTHRIAISNSRIISVSDEGVTFSAKDYRDGSTTTVTLPGVEFIRRFLLHVLPKGFQKIRYCGFLNNRFKFRNLKAISRITGKLLSKPRLAGLSMAELVLTLWGANIRTCPVCNAVALKPLGSYHMRN